MKARVVVICLVEKEGKFLLGRKAPGVGPYPDTWHTPGGGVELEHESLEEGITREIDEETGLKIKNLRRLNFDEDIEPNKHGEQTRYVFLAFGADYESGELKENDEIVTLKWFSPKELTTIELNRASIKLFKEIGLI